MEKTILCDETLGVLDNLHGWINQRLEIVTDRVARKELHGLTGELIRMRKAHHSDLAVMRVWPEFQKRQLLGINLEYLERDIRRAADRLGEMREANELFMKDLQERLNEGGR